MAITISNWLVIGGRYAVTRLFSHSTANFPLPIVLCQLTSGMVDCWGLNVGVGMLYVGNTYVGVEFQSFYLRVFMHPVVGCGRGVHLGQGALARKWVIMQC